jgi:hypothetical protein
VAFEGATLLLPRQAPWLEVLIAELLSFPGGAYDDQVDALAYGVAVPNGFLGGPLVAGPPSKTKQDYYDEDPRWKTLEGMMPNPPEGWEHLDPRPWIRRGGW